MDSNDPPSFLRRMTAFTLPRRFVVGFWFAVSCSYSLAADAPPSGPASSSPDMQVTAAPSSLFDYDTSAPLDVQEVGKEVRDEAIIRDITFAGGRNRMTAYLVSPERGGDSLAGILYVHWLGQRETTNRTEFLNEAIALASQGVVSLLIDAMWSQPKWYEKRIPEEDYDHAIAQVIDLRRALDLLVAQPGVDGARVGFVGHDFGAMYGIVMGAVDRRPSAYALMAAAPHFIDWLLFARQPKSLDEYRRQLAPLDPIVFIPKLAPTPVFLQFAARDEYVPTASADKFYSAALPRKQTAMYDAGHDLQSPDATADRINWLMRSLKLR
jgi:dienelactone hydrolase